MDAETKRKLLHLLWAAAEAGTKAALEERKEALLDGRITQAERHEIREAARDAAWDRLLEELGEGKGWFARRVEALIGGDGG